MKTVRVACLIAAFAIGAPLSLRSQSALEHAPSLPSNMGSSAPRTGIGTTSKDSAGAAASATPDPESNTAEEDDSLYRGKTSESENPMLRDEGRLHFKTHPKERVKEVDSLKSLQSTGTDPKFQGSFITSGTSSINSIADKTDKASNKIADKTQQEQAAEPAATEPTPFQGSVGRRHMKFDPPEENKPAKSEAEAKPSPSASPAKKKATDAQE
jgi:hypothetical protein